MPGKSPLKSRLIAPHPDRRHALGRVLGTMSLRARMTGLSLLAAVAVGAVLAVPLIVARDMQTQRAQAEAINAAAALWSQSIRFPGAAMLQQARGIAQSLNDMPVTHSMLLERARSGEPRELDAIEIDVFRADGSLVASSHGEGLQQTLSNDFGAIMRAVNRSGFVIALASRLTGASDRPEIILYSAVRDPSGGLIVVSTGIQAALRELETGFNGRYILRDERDLILQSSYAQAARQLLDQLDPAAAVQLIRTDRALTEVGTLNLLALTGARIGQLHLIRNVGGAMRSEALLVNSSIVLSIFVIALMAFVLRATLRSALAPLEDVTRTVTALSAGDPHEASPTSPHDDEIGRIGQAVEVLRQRALEQAREVFAERVERAGQRALIEAEMLRVSQVLEPEELAELTAELARIRDAAGDGSAQQSPIDSADRSLSLAFQLMSERVREQQTRLSALLTQRTADLATLRQALADREDLFRLREELEVARRLQLANLPDTAQADALRARIDIDASIRPAKEVGGDTYDFRLMDDRYLMLLVGDSSGKGVPAAMFVLMTRILLSAASEVIRSPAAALSLANTALSRDNESLVFTTAFLGLLDLETGELKYSNAGHNPPLIRRADGHIERVEGGRGVILGIVEQYVYEDAHLHLHEGDQIYLYSDGITEAHNVHGDMFGEARFSDECAATPQASAAQSNRRIVARVDAFADGADQFDDMTLMVATVRRLGTANR